MSAINNFRNRQLIRETWGNREHLHRNPHHHFTIEWMFVLGGMKYESQNTTKRIEQEYDKYGDILTIDYLKDSYNNLTMKTIFALFWINNHCNMTNVDYLMKTDDDTFVNFHMLTAMAWSNLNRVPLYDYICYYYKVKEVDRTGKYAEPRWRFPDKNYPRYCLGSAYTMASHMVNVILKEVPHVPIMQNEDAMLTGVCMKNVTNLQVKHLRNSLIDYESEEYYMSFERKRVTVEFQYFVIAHELPLDYWKGAYKFIIRKLKLVEIF